MKRQPGSMFIRESDVGERQTYYGAVNLTGKPIDLTPTMRVMPYTGKPVDIGEPDLNAGAGCKERKRSAK